MSKIIGNRLRITEYKIHTTIVVTKVLENAEGEQRHLLLLSPTKMKTNYQLAKRQAVTNPENTIFAAKRLIGRNLTILLGKDIEAAPLKCQFR